MIGAKKEKKTGSHIRHRRTATMTTHDHCHYHQTVRDGYANDGSRPIFDFGGSDADIMDNAELVRVGPPDSAAISLCIYVDTIVASSASSSSDCGVRHVVDDAGDGESESCDPSCGVAGTLIGVGMRTWVGGAGREVVLGFECARGRDGWRCGESGGVTRCGAREVSDKVVVLCRGLIAAALEEEEEEEAVEEVEDAGRGGWTKGGQGPLTE